jgi:ADP-ribose pyrophosphatase YjhB (NUDIX family)
MKRRTEFWWTSTCGGKLASTWVPRDQQKRLVCRICYHITYLNPKSVAGVIPVMPDGRVALLKRNIEPALGKWSYPAGYQEIGESVAEAAARECDEEICVRPKITKLLGIYSYPNAGVVTTVYVARVPRGMKPKPGIESQDVKLFKRSELPWRDLAFRSTIDALKDWMKAR